MTTDSVPAYNDYLIRRVEKLDSAFNFDEMHEIITALRTQAELSSLLASAHADGWDEGQAAQPFPTDMTVGGQDVVLWTKPSNPHRAAVPLTERNGE